MAALFNLLIFIWLPLHAGATGFQVGGGGITDHVDVPKGFNNYCNQIGHSDAIVNPVYYLRIEGVHSAFTFMAGEDSICSPIQGFFYSYKFVETKWFGLALIAGGYHFDMNNWIYEEHHVPLGKNPVTPIYSKIGNNFYFVPLIAPEFNFGLFHAGSWSLMLNAIVTPIIINYSLSIKKTF